MAVRAGATLNSTAKQEEETGAVVAAEAEGAVEEAACTEALGIAIAGKSSGVLMMYIC